MSRPGAWLRALRAASVTFWPLPVSVSRAQICWAYSKESILLRRHETIVWVSAVLGQSSRSGKSN
eukprot:162351-Pelagomonas_calceolata.AAC.2